MGNIYALVAFGLLWLVLAAFFVLLIRTLVIQARRRREGDPRVWEHGL
ncbi:hypothetical protein SAMN02745121_01497 [Nannocystis exedens]|uniref:Uncharacterized protein n=1 Tax=Nannocystis exedens TaxID=54 RepID=A0A1I1V9P4_9BACT|nr:hypothetical protein [Nannocystis exedens]PCC72295.1 hypothetical protein NAEX_05374 [Nannocystis exedens]SFD77140.1 hypothetical protein SAMN02745121_01497 [Nannocystis exedens]